MNHLLCIMKAIHRFKSLLASRRSGDSTDSLPSASRSGSGNEAFDPARAKARALEIEAVALISQRRKIFSDEAAKDGSVNAGTVGHAHDVSDAEPLFLGIGTGARDDFAMDEATPDVVADSPTAADFNIYDRAYEEAIEEHMKTSSPHKPTLYLTRFVKEKEHFKKLEDLVDNSSSVAPKLLDRFRSSGQSLPQHIVDSSSSGITQLVDKLHLGSKSGADEPAK